jgi:hypothetical protein
VNLLVILEFSPYPASTESALKENVMRYVEALKIGLLSTARSFLILALSIFYLSHSFDVLGNLTQFLEQEKPKEAQTVPSVFFWL